MILVAKTTVNLTVLFSAIQEYTGHIDKKANENNINTLLKSVNNSNLLRHVNFTFLAAIHDHVMTDIYESLDLELVTIDKSVTPRLVLITGSLEQWKTAILKGCSLKNKYELNNLLSSAFTIFKNDENMGYLWSDYRASMDKNQLKFLEIK